MRKLYFIYLSVIMFAFIFLGAENIIAQKILKLENMVLSSGDIIPSNLEGYYELDTEVEYKDFFDVYKSEMGMSQLDDFKLVSMNKDNLGFTHYKFQYYFKDVAVEGAIFILHEKDGKLKSMNGHLGIGIDVNFNVEFSKQSAISIALEIADAKVYMWELESAEDDIKLIKKDKNASYYPKPELVIVGKDYHPLLEKNHLAYKMDIYSLEPYDAYQIFIDAQGGKEILRISNIHTGNVTGTAETMYAGTQKITTDQFSGGFRLKAVKDSVLIHTKNANRQNVGVNVTDFTDNDNYWDNRNQFLDETATDVHWGAEMTYQYFKDIHGRYSIDDKGMSLLSYAHVGLNWANASWNGVYMSYGDGSNKNPLTRLPICAHELTHGVTQNTAGLIYAYESGALNESFSDIFGITTQYFANDTNTDGSMKWNLVSRNMANPNKSNHPDTYKGNKWRTGSGDNGGVHSNSQVQNYWYHLLVVGGSDTNDNKNYYDVKGIGVEKAEKIAYRNLTVYLTPSSKYSDARRGSLKATEDLYGICSEEYKQVANAWYAVGVGHKVDKNDVGVDEVLSPITSCEYLSDNEEVKFTIKSFGGCEVLPKGTEIQVKYSINSGDTLTYVVTTTKDLNGGETEEFTLDKTMNFSTLKKQDINIWTENEGDLNSENDNSFAYIESGYKNAPNNDLSVVSLNEPYRTCNITELDGTVKISIINNGCTDIAKDEVIFLSYSVNGSGAVNEELVLAEDLLSKTILEYEFDKKVEIGDGGIYSFDLGVEFDDDTLVENNKLKIDLLLGAIDGNDYAEGFENGASGWFSYNDYGNNDWKLGKPNGAKIKDASDGEFAWVTNLNGNHSDQSLMYLQSPCFDLSEMVSAEICFDAIFFLEKDYDGFVLEYSFDNENWEKAAVNGYNSNVQKTVNFGLPWFSGTNDEWTSYCSIIPEIANKETVSFRFKFGTDPRSNDEGISIDNFAINSRFGNDMKVSSLVSPKSNCHLGSEEEVKVEFVNLGTETDLELTLIMKYDGLNYIDQVDIELEFGEAYVHTFSDKIDMSAEGKTYNLDFIVAVVDDLDESNDVLRESVTKLEQHDSPLVENFEDGSKYFPLDLEFGVSKWKIYTASDIALLPYSENFPIPTHSKFIALIDFMDNSVRSDEILVSKPLRFGEGDETRLEFDYILGMIGRRASIRISTDEQETWQTVAELDRSDEWKNKKIDLSEYDGSSCVYLALHYNDEGNYSSGFAVDNIKISPKPNYDLTLNSIDISEDGHHEGEESIYFEISNEGKKVVEEFELAFDIKLEGEEPKEFVEDVNMQIGVGETVTYKSKNLILLKEGSYLISGNILKEGESSEYDNSNLNNKINLGRVNEIEEYIEDFTGFVNNEIYVLSDGWYNSSSDDLDWQFGSGNTSNVNTGPSKDHTGDKVGAYLYVNSYKADGKWANLISPSYDLSSLDKPVLKFYYSMNSSASGLGDLMGDLSIDVYDDKWHNDVWVQSGNQGSNWKEAKVNLSNFGEQIKFRFRVKTGRLSMSDIAIDDISFSDEELKKDLQLISGPRSGCGYDEDAVFTFEIRNNSGISVNDEITIYYMEKDKEVNKVTKNVNIPVNSIVELEIETGLSLVEGSYNFDYYIDWAGDEVRANDTLRAIPINSYTNLFEQKEYTECDGNTVIINGNFINNFKNFKVNDEISPTMIYVDSSSILNLEVVYENDCIMYDTLNVEFFEAPTTGLGDMTVGKVFELDAGLFESYLWQDGSTERTFLIDKSQEVIITVSDSNNCFGTDAFYITFALSADKDISEGLSFYPNPSNDYLNVEIDSETAGEVSLEILDINGKSIFHKDYNGIMNIREKIDLHELSSGSYFIKINNDSIVKVFKFTKK